MKIDLALVRLACTLIYQHKECDQHYVHFDSVEEEVKLVDHATDMVVATISY